MKKIIALALSLIMILGVLAGCSSETESNDAGTGSVTLGYAVDTNVASSKDADGEDDGLAQIETYVAAVLIDEDGKITDVFLDAVQSKVNFDSTGNITTDLSLTFDSKTTLGDDYGMVGASSIGKEWYEQVDAYQEYLIGKTADDIAGISLSDYGVPEDDELSSSVTISVATFTDLVAQAMENAEAVDASADDKITMGIVSKIDDSYSVSDDSDGLAVAYNTIAIATFDSSNKITATIFDAVQGKVEFAGNGTLITDLDATFATKQEMGDDYGMVGVSEIGKEWYEQADALAEYTVGKSIGEVTGISLSEDGTAADEDLNSSVTIGISDMISALERAEDQL